MHVCSCCSLRVLLPCVRAGAFVHAYLMLTLILTVGSLLFFFFFSSLGPSPITGILFQTNDVCLRGGEGRSLFV